MPKEEQEIKEDIPEMKELKETEDGYVNRIKNIGGKLESGNNAFSHLEMDVNEDGEDFDYFFAATTVPDRVRVEYPPGSGNVADGDILSKELLESIAAILNDKSKLGGEYGAYRTISLFHDRVVFNDQTLEEAGYIHKAEVVGLPTMPGHFGLMVKTEVNKYYNPSEYFPDMTAEKIKYKIAKGAIGLSIEFLEDKNANYKTVTVGDKTYRYVDKVREFMGFGYARANVIGNTTAIALKENNNVAVAIKELKNSTHEEIKMEANEGAQFEAQIKELQDQISSLKETGNKESEIEDLNAKIKELRANNDKFAADLKDSIKEAFSGIAMERKNALVDGEKKVAATIKEAVKAVEDNNVSGFTAAIKEHLDANVADVKKALKEGIRLEEAQTLSVRTPTLKERREGKGMIVETTVRTKDVLDSGDMAESTYNQANAMFADRYVQGITETFLKDDTLLTAMVKEQHIGGNTYYQWKLWTEFIDASSSTLAVDPDTTSVSRNVSNFEKMQTPIKEYRDGVEVTDFTQAHSRAAVGDLMEIEMRRAAERVTQSMAADLFKENADGDSNQFLGLEAVADSAGNTTLYGKVRSTTNRLAPDAAGDTYDSTSEAISEDLLREGYEKVLAAGSSFSDIAIVMHPTQARKLFSVIDTNIRHNVVTMTAVPEFGFRRNVIPTFDGIPIIRDYNCQSDAFYVVDMSQEKGFVLVVSKPLGARGLAKVGTSEAAYVNFWGAAVYKSPRNVFLHDSLT